MGRCYEFGLAIHDGCEQTMAVPAEGGRCVCESCGTECRGRFATCAEIIFTPGYVPPLAPAWAHPGVPPAPEVDSTNGTLNATPVVVAPADTSAQAPPDRRTDREQRLTERNRALTASLGRLRAVVEEVKSEVVEQRQAVANLSTQLSDQANAVDRLTAVVEDLRARLAAADARAAGAQRSIWRRP